MVYSGNKLLNTNNGFFLIMTVFCAVMIDGHAFLAAIAFFLLCALLAANEAFYFELTNDEFIVKNYMVPLVNIKYHLTDITEIVFAENGRRATADAKVKIYYNGKESSGYGAASLKLPDWQNMATDLSKKKIAVTITAIKLTNKIGLPED